MSWLKDVAGDFAVGTASSLVGGLIGTASSRSNARYNAQLSRDNWIYQQSHAHQLEVQDLKAAGLNPILSATNSQMANMSPVQGSDYGNFGSNISSAIQNAFERRTRLDMQARELEIQNTLAKIEQTRAETEKFKAEAYSNLANSSANLNNAKVVIDRMVADARVSQIKQDIENSVSTTKALIEKYGAESSQARAVAYNQLKQAAHAIELATGQKLSNEDYKLFMKNPKRLLEREAFQDVKDNYNASALFKTAIYLKSLFGGVDTVSFGRTGFRFGSSSK